MRPQMSRPAGRLAALASIVTLGLALSSRAADSPSPHTSANDPEAKPVALGTSPAYGVLGQLPMMHEGRAKPIDTVAREEIKQIYTRETIKLPKTDTQPATTWTPVAALLDWSVRPKFWDNQPIIAVEYLPLKQMIFADEVHQALETVAGKATTPAAARKQFLDLAGIPQVDAAQLRNVVRNSGVAEEDGKTLLALAAKIGEETKWLSSADLENAQVTVEGKPTPFLAWLQSIAQRAEELGSEATLPDLDQKALSVGKKLSHYRAIRDREAMGQVPLLAMPRPASPAMIAYTAESFKKARATGGEGLSTLEYETVNMLTKFLNDIPRKDQSLPGESPEFDARYASWLQEKSAWVPINVIREASIDELTRAGFPTAKVEAFRTAYKAVEDEELLHPGSADAQPSLALIDSARDLGNAVNASRYPTAAEMLREAHFNEVAPFFKAPMAYLVGLLLLGFSLIATSFGRSMHQEAFFGKLSQALYLGGLGGLAAGIALEVFGFYLRIRISGWAPVTNMYETVIYVALVGSILGLIFETISRRTFVALGATGLGLLGTFLAANVEMLDPSIKQLPPVLRSNLWLTVHVMTIVSSYAAFALAMMLGLIATGTYLVATYKRSATVAELVTPLLAGIPILGLGVAGFMMNGRTDYGPIWAGYGHLLSFAVAGVGGVFCGMAIFGLIGESINRVSFRPTPAAEAGEPAVDARQQAMQHTAGQIKPMANFIYRSMQVGILLVAAGTFLGGWWADVSWGRFWGWDPKEVWALITLLVYLMPLHGRFAGWVNTFWLVMSSLLCFSSVLMAWYGVNFVLGVGLHSYGFTSGTGHQGNVATATLVVLAFAAGTWWRRKVSSQVVSAA